MGLKLLVSTGKHKNLNLNDLDANISVKKKSNNVVLIRNLF